MGEAVGLTDDEVIECEATGEGDVVGGDRRGSGVQRSDCWLHGGRGSWRDRRRSRTLWGGRQLNQVVFDRVRIVADHDVEGELVVTDFGNRVVDDVVVATLDAVQRDDARNRDRQSLLVGRHWFR